MITIAVGIILAVLFFALLPIIQLGFAEGMVKMLSLKKSVWITIGVIALIILLANRK